MFLPYFLFVQLNFSRKTFANCRLYIVWFFIFNLQVFSDQNTYNKYTEQANQPHYRKRRQLEDAKKTCFMSLRADVLLYKHFLVKASNNAVSGNYN